MTPLSEALTAAQKRALTALEKAYVAGQIDPEGLTAALQACGISDPVDIGYLAECLDVLKAWGAPLPAENGNGAPAEQPAQASQVIDELQAGSYDPQKWQPF